MTTVSHRNDGVRLARSIVERKLAACVQLLPPMVSVYSWEGKIHESEECLLLIKTTRSKWEALADIISDEHSYDVPEVIALTADQISADYYDWMLSSTDQNP
jgi:periplasmic divalent cation tolerance protein